MGVSFNISRQGKRYMPNDAVYVCGCPCVRVCVYAWMRAKVNLAASNQVIPVSGTHLKGTQWLRRVALLLWGPHPS